MLWFDSQVASTVATGSVLHNLVPSNGNTVTFDANDGQGPIAYTYTLVVTDPTTQVDISSGNKTVIAAALATTIGLGVQSTSLSASSTGATTNVTGAITGFASNIAIVSTTTAGVLTLSGFSGGFTGGSMDGDVGNGVDYWANVGNTIPAGRVANSTDDVTNQDTMATGTATYKSLTGSAINGAVISVVGTVSSLTFSGGSLSAAISSGVDYEADPGNAINGIGGCTYNAVSFANSITDNGSGNFQGSAYNGFVQINGSVTFSIAISFNGGLTVTGTLTAGTGAVPTFVGSTVTAGAINDGGNALILPNVVCNQINCSMSTLGTVSQSGKGVTLIFATLDGAVSWPAGTTPATISGVASSSLTAGVWSLTLPGSGGTVSYTQPPDTANNLILPTAFGGPSYGAASLVFPATNVVKSGSSAGSVNGVSQGTGTYTGGGGGAGGNPIMIPIASSSTLVAAGPGYTVIHDVGTTVSGTAYKVSTLSLQLTAPLVGAVSLRIGVRVQASGEIIFPQGPGLAQYLINGQYPIPPGGTSAFAGIPVIQAVDSVLVYANLSMGGPENIISGGSLA